MGFGLGLGLGPGLGLGAGLGLVWSHPWMTRSASPLERSPIEKSSQRLCTLASWSRWIRSGLGPTGSSAAEEPSGQYFLMIESWLGLAYL